MESLRARLESIVGKPHVLASAVDMAPYLVDWRGRYAGEAMAVVRPANTGEVSAIVQLCAREGVPMVPQGGNTSLCGAATPLQDGRSVVISLGRLNRIRRVDPINDTLVAEAGCTLRALQDAAEEVGRLFPLSLASEGSCQLGGNLSTNAGGVHVLRYGNTRELALGLEVVLPDGRVWDGLRGLRKDNTGYDLKQLFIGAEGTLGIVTAAVMKLFPRPRAKSVSWLAVPTPQAAVELLGFVRARCGDRLSAFEIVGREALELVMRHIPGARNPLPEVCDWQVLMELTDASADVALDALAEQALVAASEQGLVTDGVIAASDAQSAALWALRENISEAQKIEGVSIKHDISVPVSLIPDFIAQAAQRLATNWKGLRIVVFGHIGDGNLHYNLSKPVAMDNGPFIESSATVNRVVHDLVVELGGSISAEHGLGQLKRSENARYKSAVELDLMRSIKSALDPQGLMNPGKVI